MQTAPQAKQTVDEKLEVVLLMNEEGMIELGHHLFDLMDLGSDQMTADITKRETGRHHVPLDGRTPHYL